MLTLEGYVKAVQEKEGRAELRGDIMAHEIIGLWRITVKVSRYPFSSALLLREQ